MDEQPELELRHYLNVLRRRVGVVVLVTVLAVGAALAVSLTSTRIYEASADVLITDTSQDTVFGSGAAASSDSSRRVATQIEVLQTRPIANAVDKELGADASEVTSVSVAAVGETDIITVSVQSPDPEVAQRAANLYATTYVQTRQRQQVESLLQAGTEVQKKLDEIQTQIDLTEPGPERDALSTQFELFKQKTAYEINFCLVGSEMCIRDSAGAGGSARRSWRRGWPPAARPPGRGSEPVSYTHLTLPTTPYV